MRDTDVLAERSQGGSYTEDWDWLTGGERGEEGWEEGIVRVEGRLRV